MHPFMLVGFFNKLLTLFLVVSEMMGKTIYSIYLFNRLLLLVRILYTNFLKQEFLFCEKIAFICLFIYLLTD